MENIRTMMTNHETVYKYVKSLYSRGSMLISRFKTVKLFSSFLCNDYGCHLWSKYKQYSYRCVVVAFNNEIRQKMIYVCNLCL